MPKLLRITTVPMSLHLLLPGQMKHMREHGFEVIMISADGPELEEVKKNEQCPHMIVPFTRAITPVQDAACLRQLITLFRRERPDIVHTHTPKAGLLGMLAARLTSVPVRIHTIAGLPFMTATGARRRLLMNIERLTFWGAQHVWPNSQSMFDFVRDHRLCPARKLEIIGAGSTNGIDLTHFSPKALQPEVIEQVKTKIAYDPANTYLLAVGRVVKDKGIPELVAAFEQLQQEHHYLRLVLAGPLEEERKEELLSAHTLAAIRTNAAIQHVGWTDEVATYLHLADFLVHASHREGFPNVLLQAGAMKCPIICSDIPGNIDIVTNKQTGRLFPVGDTATLMATIEAALANPELTQQMTKNLRTVVAEKFDRKIIQAALLQKYREILDH